MNGGAEVVFLSVCAGLHQGRCCAATVKESRGSEEVFRGRSAETQRASHRLQEQSPQSGEFHSSEDTDMTNRSTWRCAPSLSLSAWQTSHLTEWLLIVGTCGRTGNTHFCCFQKSAGQLVACRWQHPAKNQVEQQQRGTMLTGAIHSSSLQVYVLLTSFFSLWSHQPGENLHVSRPLILNPVDGSNYTVEPARCPI